MLRLRQCLAVLAVVGLWLEVPVGSATAGPAEVRQIQQTLRDLGLDPGPVDGAWGRKTEEAARRHLKSRGVDPATIFEGGRRDEPALLAILRQTATPGRRTSLRATVVPQFKHAYWAEIISYSGDGNYVLTASNDKTIKLWDVRSKRLIRTFSGHLSRIALARFLDGVSRIISVDDEMILKIWDSETGELLRSLNIEIEFFSLESARLTPDNKYLLLFDGADFVKYNIRQEKIVSRKELTGGVSVYDHFYVLSRDGSKLLFAVEAESGTKHTLVLWDLQRGRVMRQFSFQADFLFSGDFSPDGRLIAVGTRPGKGRKEGVTIWNAVTGKLVKTLSTDAPAGNDESVVVEEVLFARDGAILATCRDGRLNLWEVAGWRLVATAGNKFPHCSKMVFSPSGRFIINAGEQVWDIEAKRAEPLAKAIEPLSVTGAKFNHNGSRLVTTGRYGLTSWDVDSGRQTLTLGRTGADHVIKPDFKGGPTVLTADGSKLVTYDKKSTGLYSFDFNTKRIDEKGKIPRKIGVYVTALAIDPESGHLMTGTPGSLDLWSLKDLRHIRKYHIGQQEADVSAIRISSDGRLVAAMLDPDIVIVFDKNTGARLQLIENDEYHWLVANDIAFIGNNSDLLIAANNTLIGLDARTGKPEFRFEDASLDRIFSPKVMSSIKARQPHFGYVDSVSVSQNNRHVISGGGEGTIKLWDARSRRLLRTFRGQNSGIADVTFSPDGQRFASTGVDGTIRIWSPDQAAALVTFMETDKGWLAVTPEGFFAGPPAAAEALAVTRGFDTYAIDQFYQALYRPDLVREKLAGDPKGKVRDAAAKLNLDKIIESGSAPRVAITSPASGNSVTDDKLSVEASISDAGGGIGRIEWRVNGLTLGVHTKRGFERVAEDTAKTENKAITVTQDLWLEPGKNTIEVVAYNARNLIASEPAKITVTWDGQTSKTPPRLHVLAIGVNDYWDSRLRLAHAVPDAKAIGAALRQSGGDLYETVSVTNLVDDEVTADKLEAAFEKLGTEVRPRDVFLFFLAGHGKTVDGKYYFIPQDFRYTDETSVTTKGIGQDKWQRWFSRIPARKSLLLYDTCESGSLTGDRILTRSMERIAALEKLTRAMGRTVLSAATDEAPALEGYKGHGVFTYALLDALNRSDANNNNLIEVTELAGHVDAQVPEISYKAFGFRQVPQMKIVGSNFPLAKRTAALSDQPADAKQPAISKKPTHVVITPTDLFPEAGGAGTVVTKLKPGTLVTMVRTESGWTLIAKDGKQLGFVADGSLLKAQ